MPYCYWLAGEGQPDPTATAASSATTSTPTNTEPKPRPQQTSSADPVSADSRSMIGPATASLAPNELLSIHEDVVLVIANDRKIHEFVHHARQVLGTDSPPQKSRT